MIKIIQSLIQSIFLQNNKKENIQDEVSALYDVNSKNKLRPIYCYQRTNKNQL